MTESVLPPEADAILWRFEMLGGDNSLRALEEMNMPVDMLLRTVDWVLKKGYLRRTNFNFKAIWLDLTKKGRGHLIETYGGLPRSMDDMGDRSYQKFFKQRAKT